MLFTVHNASCTFNSNISCYCRPTLFLVCLFYAHLLNYLHSLLDSSSVLSGRLALSPFILKQSLFFTNRWHCGIRVTATPPVFFKDSFKMLRSAAMNMKKGAKAMENRIEGCRLQQKADSVTKLLHKTNSLCLRGIEAHQCSL